MFDNVFDSVLAQHQLSEHCGPTAGEVQRVFDECIAQGLSPAEAIQETETLCNIRDLTLNTKNQVAAFRSH